MRAPGASGSQQGDRGGQGAQRGSRSPRQGHRPGGRQRRRPVRVDPDRVGPVGADRGPDPVGGRDRPLSQPPSAARARSEASTAVEPSTGMRRRRPTCSGIAVAALTLLMLDGAAPALAAAASTTAATSSLHRRPGPSTTATPTGAAWQRPRLFGQSLLAGVDVADARRPALRRATGVGRAHLRRHRERHRVRPLGHERRCGMVEPPRHARALGVASLRQHLPQCRDHRHARDRRGTLGALRRRRRGGRREPGARAGRTEHRDGQDGADPGRRPDRARRRPRSCSARA